MAKQHFPNRSCLLLKITIMKTLGIKTICLFFIITAFISCSKTGTAIPVSPKGSTGEGLAGTWNWVRTDGGIANNIHETPATTGKNIHLKITDNNQYFIYTNGTLTSQGTYTLETRSCIHDNVAKKFINFSILTDEDMMIEIVDNLSLKLSDEANDGLEILYSRN